MKHTIPQFKKRTMKILIIIQSILGLWFREKNVTFQNRAVNELSLILIELGSELEFELERASSLLELDSLTWLNFEELTLV